MSLICLETLTSMHVFPATANDCILQTNSFGLVNRHIFRPIGRNFHPLVIGNLLAYSSLIWNGICSYSMWWRMLNNPMLGMNMQTIDNILRTLAKTPHAKMNIFEVIGQIPFSVLTFFKCNIMQVFKLQLIESTKTVVASIPNVLWLKMISRPPVVSVFVDANKRIRIWIDTCRNTSVPNSICRNFRSWILFILLSWRVLIKFESLIFANFLAFSLECS